MSSNLLREYVPFQRRAWEPFKFAEVPFDIKHEYGNFHQAGKSKRPKLAGTVQRLRRKRAGQLSLFT